MKRKTAVLLVNLGSPDSPAPKDVKRYLTQFLNDPRVVDLPWLGRKLLVNGIIVPFRYRKSAKVYQELWTENGSPLVHYGKQVKQLLQDRFNENETKVFLAMRYQNPSLITTLLEIEKWSADHVIVIPMFPQYASATTGSVMDEVMRLMKDMYVIPEVTTVNQFYDHPLYIKGFVENGSTFNWKEYDHVLFSYHGLPERQLDKIYDDRKCSNHTCEHEINEENRYCYKATCYATTREIAKGLGIPEEKYTVCFQSRLGKGWIEPFSDSIIRKMASEGAKKLLVFSPAFVADCLETTIEIGEEYQELFEELGGEKIQLVPSLNESRTWIDCLEDLVKTRTVKA
ncbi:MAG: ferrochelatase [Flavobacteriales bacterium]|jgi:ferrochelatase